MPCPPDKLQQIKMKLRKERAKKLRSIGRKNEARILEDEDIGRAEFKELAQDTEEETAMLLKNCNSRMEHENIARRDALNALRHIQTKELKKATKAYKKLEKKKRKRETRKDKKLRKKQRHARVANMLQGSQNGLPALDLSGSGSAGGGGSHSWGSEPLADTDAFVVESERSPGGTHRQRKRTARELAALRAG